MLWRSLWRMMVPGISEDIRVKIFDPFFHHQGSGQRVGAGVGHSPRHSGGAARRGDRICPGRRGGHGVHGASSPGAGRGKLTITLMVMPPVRGGMAPGRRRVDSGDFAGIDLQHHLAVSQEGQAFLGAYALVQLALGLLVRVLHRERALVLC